MRDDCSMSSPVAEVEIGEDLVRRLLAQQRPEWADLGLVRVGEGWDNVLFRLGDDLAVRMPRRAMAAHLVVNEQRWLPVLAPRLPLPVPVPLHLGVAGHGYPWSWSVVPWIEGDVIDRQQPADWTRVATQLGTFLAALHAPAPRDAPSNPYRGGPLVERTDRLLAGLDVVGDVVDRSAVEAAWAMLVDTPADGGAPRWLHGDLHPLNILVDRGVVSGVIDFGDITAGDRAADLSVAWTVLPGPVRAVFREAAGSALPVDDHTWDRARAWALALGIAYLHGDGRVAAIGDRAVVEALTD